MFHNKFFIFISAFSLIFVASFVSVGLPAQAAQCAAGQALCNGMCQAISSTPGTSCGGIGTGHTYSDQCGTCACAPTFASCSVSTACVRISDCQSGTTFNPCSGPTGACYTPYTLRNPSIAQGDYIAVRGTTLAVETATPPEGSLFYNETRGRLRVKTGAAISTWQDVGGTTYTAGPNIAITGTSINTAPFLGGVGGIFVTGVVAGSSGTAADPHGIYLNPGMALRVESGDDSSLNVGNYSSGAGAGDNFHLRIHSPDAAISELVLDQGGTDRWTIGARTPSRNFEIWRNNPTGAWAPSLQINFSDGGVLAATRFGVGASAPYPQDESIGIERHFTVGGRYENTVSGSCPSGTFAINLDAIRGGLGITTIGAGECYRPDITGATLNQNVLSGRFNMFGDARFREDVTVDGDTEVQGLTADGTIRAHREIVIEPTEDTFNARLPSYLRISNLDNDSGNGNPEQQYAIKVKDEDNNDWFSVRRTGYERTVDVVGVEVHIPAPVQVSTSGNISAGGNISASDISARDISARGALAGVGLLISGSGTLDRLIVGSAATNLGGGAAGDSLFSGLANYAAMNPGDYLLRLRTSSDDTAAGTLTDRLTLTRDGMMTLSGNLSAFRVDVGRGGLVVAAGSDTLLGDDLDVGGSIVAGTANIRITNFEGRLKLAKLAREDFDDHFTSGDSTRNEGYLIIGLRANQGTCNNACDKHGLICNSVNWIGREIITTFGSDGCENRTEHKYCWCGG